MIQDKNDMAWQVVPEGDHYARGFLYADAWREPITREAVTALDLPLGSRGLDAGCGIGLQVMQLAEAVGPTGHVTGLDLSTQLLAYGQRLAEKAGLSDRISYREGDVGQLPFDDGDFDWAWSVDCVGYFPVDPRPTVKELARVVKPGGRVALLIYSSQQMLPGYPLLEARLNATAAGIAPFRKGMRPEWHYYRTLGLFRELGLQDPAAKALVGSVHAPLCGNVRRALADLFEMRWGGAQSELSPEDWTEYRRLCEPESPDFLLSRPDYYAFFTYSLFQAKVAG